jgi:hypothetical protein
MKGPLVELADIVAAAAHHFTDQPPGWFTWMHLKVLVAIERCRTAAMGGHMDQCSGCGHRTISYNSCRNRHCPKCQSQVRDRWLAARRTELLAAPYAHVVFTLPHQLAPLALQNKELIYGLLFRASAQTLIQIAADARHLGAEIGFFSVLHTWNQKLQHHPHVHCVVAAGGLTRDHTHWVRPGNPRFFLPQGVLSEVFRGKFIEGLQHAHASGQLQFHGLLRGLAEPKLFRSFIRQLFGPRWVVYCKPPFGIAIAFPGITASARPTTLPRPIDNIPRANRRMPLIDWLIFHAHSVATLEMITVISVITLTVNKSSCSMNYRGGPVTAGTGALMCPRPRSRPISCARI